VLACVCGSRQPTPEVEQGHRHPGLRAVRSGQAQQAVVLRFRRSAGRLQVIRLQAVMLSRRLRQFRRTGATGSSRQAAQAVPGGPGSLVAPGTRQVEGIRRLQAVCGAQVRRPRRPRWLQAGSCGGHGWSGGLVRLVRRGSGGQVAQASVTARPGAGQARFRRLQVVRRS
jgi:hypothetical protein